MSDPGQPVTADADTLALLVREFEFGESDRDLEDVARERDVNPPDDRDGWEIVYRYGPGGEGLGLHWVHPDDEPVQHID